ncbi:MAG TPA: peptidylprolyl isomerase [Rhodanobacteraceae bacterium]|nr:peptidylprolyl isomerase [Rhodanobacteraceae bacterium]
MKNLILAFVLAAAAFAAPRAVLAQATGEPLDRIVAVVDEDVVLQSELDRQVTRVTAQYAQSPQQLPPRDVLEHQVLERLILQKLQITRADSSGVKVSDAEVDQALTGLAAQNKMDLSQLRMAIQSQGMDYEQFRRNVRDELLVQRLRQRVVQSRVQVSDAEVETLLKNGAMHRGQIHLGYILISVPDGATPDQLDAAKKKAEETKQQIDGGMDFAAAAIRYSDAPNALEGGDLGWRAADELPQAFAEFSDKMSEGQVSDPIRGPNGFHIIKLLGKRAPDAAQLVTEFKARHLLFKITELVSSEQAQKAAATARQRVVGGEDFAKVAKDVSQDTATARLGGELGWFSGDAYGTRVAEVVKGLKSGEISQPFETDAGWHVLQLEETRSTDKTVDLQRDQAKNMIFQRKAEDEYESFLRQIRSEAYVEVRLPGAQQPGASPTTGAP